MSILDGLRVEKYQPPPNTSKANSALHFEVTSSELFSNRVSAGTPEIPNLYSSSYTCIRFASTDGIGG
jgi:hypothetical protein